MAALATFFIHNGYKDSVCMIGWSSMTLFFAMSGFLMMMHHDRDELRRTGLAGFYTKRLWKVYALHWLSLAALLLLILWHRGDFGYTPALLPNFLLIHCYFPSKDIFMSYNGVTWFLSGIVLCYLCYPFLLRDVSSAVRRLIIVVTAVCYASVAARADAHGAVYLYVFPPLRMVEFMIGMEAYILYRNIGKLKVSRLQATVIDLTLLAVYVALLIFGKSGLCHENYLYSLLWWPLAAVMCVLVPCLSGREGALGRLLTSKPLIWLGKISLEIFLFHGPIAVIVAYFVIPVVNKAGGGFFDEYLLNLPVLAWVYLPFTIVGSWLIHKYVTVPLERKFKGWWNARFAENEPDIEKGNR